MIVLGPVVLGIDNTQHAPKGRQPERIGHRIRQDKQARNNAGIQRCRIEDSGDQSRPGTHQLTRDPCDQPSVEGRKGDRTQAHGKFIDPMQVEGKEPNHQPHHRWMVEMIPVQLLGIGEVIDLIITQFHKAREDTANDRGNNDEPAQFYSVFIFHR